jgi:Domain of unknown function (DUF1735)
MKKLLFILCAGVLLTSCLKDKDYENQLIGHQVGDQKLIELVKPNSTNSITRLALDFKDELLTVNILPARISSGVGAEGDISVVLDTTVTTKYIADNIATDPSLKHFKTITGSIVTPLTLTIPSGSQASQTIQIRVNSISFDPSSSYVLGFKIQSVSNGSYLVNANYKTHYIILSAKNKYDGVYQLVGYHNRPTLDAPYDEEVHMITSGANSVTMYWPSLGNYAHPLNGGVTYYGNFTQNYIFDPATNVMTAWDLQPYPFTLTSAQVYPGSYYDPATKIIYANTGYNANAARRFFDVLTFKGAR